MCGFFKGDSSEHQKRKRDKKKESCMLSARSLSIAWGDDKRYWNWINMPDSRFPEVAQLLKVWWLDISGTINTLSLSPNTQYAAYLVFKMIEAEGFQNCPIELSVGVEGGQSGTKIVCLDPNVEGGQHNRAVGLQRPSVRSDGWLEIEMGEFNSGLEDGDVLMNVKETNNWKSGLFVEGIEVRPK
ncbi:putative phloem protein [Medicago truncatula]|uniref:Phloem protein n=1 Tax=Medicago truncatula TaxID=3880 RepID=A0A072VMX3_MEDTR|nr:F-box protein PP2-B10 [Medicago truncatula]KEH42966.1 phloem protein [Medicago truncatula]RHN80554.1 putative phloem protein [Medicago truncatula]